MKMPVRLKIKHIPSMYLFFYCKLRNNAVSNIVKTGKAEAIIYHQLPRLLKRIVLNEMVGYGLIRRLHRDAVEIVDIDEKQLNKLGIEIVSQALEEKR